MKLVFLYGVPATGKLTVARELALLTGYKLFHNHLAVDLLLAVFEFGSPSFIRLREEIWLAVFEEASRSGTPGLIFTFAPEPTVRPQFIPVALDAMTRSGGEMDFVELVCPLAELRNRIDHPSRMRFQKLTSLTLFEQLHSKGAFDSSQTAAGPARNRYECLRPGRGGDPHRRDTGARSVGAFCCSGSRRVSYRSEMMRGSRPDGVMVTSATVTGRLKRRGPALPGFKKRTP